MEGLCWQCEGSLSTRVATDAKVICSYWFEEYPVRVPCALDKLEKVNIPVFSYMK
jgi:hypothetical protein